MFIPDIRVVCLTFILSLFASAAFAEIYKWSDQNEQINYSQQAPPNIPYTIVKILPPPPIDPNVAQKEIDELIKSQEAEEKVSLDEATQKESEAEKQKRFEENCLIAKDNLLKYQNNPGRRMIDEQGIVTKPTEEERQQKIKESQDNVNKYCQ